MTWTLWVGGSGVRNFGLGLQVPGSLGLQGGRHTVKYIYIYIYMYIYLDLPMYLY